MPEHAPGVGPDWFVYADVRRHMRGLSGRVLLEADVVLRDSQNRAWFAARCQHGYVSHAKGDRRELLVLGPGAVSARDFLLHCGGAVSNLPSVMQEHPGVYSAVLRIGDEMAFFAPMFGGPQLYFRLMPSENVVVVSDRAQLLGRIELDGCRAPAQVNYGGLAARLLNPMPLPLAESTLWREVERVPPGHWLHLVRSSHPRLRRWWCAPAPEGKGGEAADGVAAALRGAVAAHTDAHQAVASDLSGGFDSSTLTAFAHVRRQELGRSHLIAITVSNRDPAHQDEYWAQIVAEHLGAVDRVLVESREVPRAYASLDGPSDLDEPSVLVCQRARVKALVSAGAPATVQLSGHGGDHLFGGVPAHAASLLRQNPIDAAGRLRGYAGLNGWPLWRTFMQVVDPRNYNSWLRQSALTREPLGPRSPSIAWGSPAQVHPWITPETYRLLSRSVRRAADTARPLARTRARHLHLDGLLSGAQTARDLRDLTAAEGHPMVSPYFDDRVVEAVLRAPSHLMCDPTKYKPLLAAAARHHLPARLLERTTKDHSATDDALGLSEFRHQIMGLWEDSRLANAGLVDSRLLRRLCAEPAFPAIGDGRLWPTIACELWARSQEAPDTPSRRFFERTGNEHYSVDSV